MYVTLAILKSMLDCEFEQNGENQNAVFTQVEMLDESAQLQGDPSTLYISALSDALKFPREGKQLHFMCIRDRFSDDSESPEGLSGISVVKKNMRLSALFNSVQRIFMKVFNWQYEMRKAVPEGESIQRLLDLSEEMIGNHIDVMDSTFKLVAYTKNTKIDDPVTNDLVRLGYHSQETVKRLQKYRRFEQFENTDGLIVSTDRLMSDFVVVKYVFRNFDTYSYFVVMVCSREYSDCILDLFKMLVENIATCLGKLLPNGRPGPFAALAADLLDGRIGSLTEAQERAAHAKIIFKGSFNLFLLRFPDSNNLPLSRILSTLAGALHSARVISYKRDILVINLFADPAHEAQGSADRLEKIAELLKGEPCSVGVSDLFPNLYDLSSAYHQALTALELGSELPEKAVSCPCPNEQMKVCHFEDYLLYYCIRLCGNAKPDLLKNSMAGRAMETLAAYEQKYHVDYIHILKTYLACGCRATLTAAQLHVHRNTVLYHVERIEELLGISLDDDDVRVKLSLALRAMEVAPLSGDANAK